MKVPGKQERHPIGVLPKPANIETQKTDVEQWAAFTKAHHLWSQHGEPYDRLPLTEWTEKTMEILCDCMGAPVQGVGVHVEEEMWAKLMGRKRRWAARNALSGEVEGGGNVRGTHDARKALRGRRGAASAPIASIQNSKGEIC